MALSFAASCDRPDGTWAATGSEPAADTPTAVVVELFTSEGCSSCPPADDVLRELVGRQPFKNINVIGLGEHVDYWDRLGWRDPFSAAAFTTRQSEYEARAFRTGSIYTPQIVVDGRFQQVGSDRAAVRRAISLAASLPKATVDVQVLAQSPTDVQVRIRAEAPVGVPRREPADVIVGLVEDGLATNVQRGENRGRTLKHRVVTRSLTTLGTLNPTDRTISQTASVPLASAWKPSAVRVVAFLQERTTRHIIGAASTRLEPEDEHRQ
jgi:hypothetical protein